MKTVTAALAGNPNCGKTTLFNQLTGGNQSVGNWPGVTVEKKEGIRAWGQDILQVTDLPGIYSLTTYSAEEKIACDFFIRNTPDVIINVVDATNLERNLYFTLQLRELGLPIVVALNMADILEKRGVRIDCRQLERAFQCPVVSVCAASGQGIPELLERVRTVVDTPFFPLTGIYAQNLEQAVQELEIWLEQKHNRFPRWTAMRLLEQEVAAWKEIRPAKTEADRILQLRQKIEAGGTDMAMLLADQRYRFLEHTVKRTVHGNLHQRTWTERVDRILLHRIWGIPIFFTMVLFVFFAAFGPLGSAFTSAADWIVQDWFAGHMREILTGLHASNWVCSLILDGLVTGLGAVLSFLPQLAILFLLLSLLEDSGYMARAALLMDHFMRKIGLSGRAFVPVMMGFGCTVPAVMATRILEQEKDKRLTILILPFMSCSAKLPVYSMMITVFFEHNRPLIIFSIYLLGILIGFGSAWLFRNTLLKGAPASFLMELPPYRFPTVRGIMFHMKARIGDFLKKAGTVLFLAMLVIWFFRSFSPQLQFVSDSTQSMLAQFGMAIAPIFSLCGFPSWQAAVSLATGVVAKESVVSTMALLCGGEHALAESLQALFTPISAYSFLLFTLLYTPCVATISVIRREMGSVRWAVVTVVYQMGAAWFLSALFFQVATLLTHLIL